jgi:hypothetical protein
LNKNRLIQIIRDPGIATEMEIKEIKTLSNDYSYSSFLKVLRARIDNLHDKKNKSKSLSRAAIYIADRTVLKEFILHDKTIEIKENIDDSPNSSQKLEDEVDIRHDAELTDVDDTREVSISKTPRFHDIDGHEQKTEEKMEDEKVMEKRAAEEKEDDKQIQDIGDNARSEKDQKIMEKKETQVDLHPDEKHDEASAESMELEGKETETADGEILEDNIGTTMPPEEVKPEYIHEDLEVHQEMSKDEEEEISNEEKTIESNIDDTETTYEKEEIEKVKKEEETSLSNEILKNISELRKHKASLFNFLNLDSKSKQKSEKPKSKKSSKKEKKDKQKDKMDQKDERESDNSNEKEGNHLNANPLNDDSNNAYPDHEEEDPKVIKDFLNKLEKENPPPKKKLKKEEQEKLIEKFIQTDPQMKNVRPSEERPEKKDLSLPSVKFRDDIISENLANIMVKQGKHEKAIDIYKKLIWKFPQKKTYFATQIEALKKKSDN